MLSPLNGTGISGITLTTQRIQFRADGQQWLLLRPAVPTIWSGTITSHPGSSFFLPSVRSYSALNIDTPNQNFMAASPATDFNFTGSQFDGTNMNVNWYGINGVTYQMFSSSNLVNWVPYGSPFARQQCTPITNSASPDQRTADVFFRLGVSY